MQPTQFGMEPFADRLAISNHDRTHEWIRADPPTPALSQLQREPEMHMIRGCQL